MTMEPFERAARMDARRLINIYFEIENILKPCDGDKIAGFPKIPKYCNRASYLRLCRPALKRAIRQLTPDWNGKGHP